MYNTRKDTKKYRDLVKGYCDARLSVEFYDDMKKDETKRIEECQAELDKGIYNEVVENALKTSISGAKMVIGMRDSSQHYDVEKMELYGKQLVEEYGDDLEKVYKQHKNDW